MLLPPLTAATISDTSGAISGESSVARQGGASRGRQEGEEEEEGEREGGAAREEQQPHTRGDGPAGAGQRDVAACVCGTGGRMTWRG